MKKIRIGNDFIFLWRIMRGEMSEDLTLATSIVVKYCGIDGVRIAPHTLVGSSTIRIEVTPIIADRLGDYRFEVSYSVPDISASDGDQKSRADITAFTIVPLTEQAETITQLEGESDVLIGLRGRAFVYEDFTEEQLDDLRRASVEAGERADISAQNADDKADLANTAAIYANDRGDYADDRGNYAQLQGDYAKAQGDNASIATGNAGDAIQYAIEQGDYAKEKGDYADQKAIEAINSASNADSSALLADNQTALADTATLNANTATTNANTAIGKANTATNNADSKAQLADTAAQNADDRVDALNSTFDIWEVDEQGRKDAEIIRIANDASRINSTKGTVEYNEINII